MEEADVLGDRIAIMADGKVNYIASHFNKSVISSGEMLWLTNVPEKQPWHRIHLDSHQGLNKVRH